MESPALACVRLGVALCRSADQLAAWWDWPPHRAARWALSAEEQAAAGVVMEERRVALESGGVVG